MLFEIVNDKLKVYKSIYNPKELEIEKFIISSGEDNILNESVFGEPLLVINNQVRTRNNKRADILALDKFGNGVIIELKRDKGNLGVETQALQYLVDFSAYKGENFIKFFSKYNQQIEENIKSFLGDSVDIQDINRSSRIILVARSFDPALYSMGEWLSNNGVSFRCIKYEAYEINSKKILSFSVAFDRSKNYIYNINLEKISRTPKYFWHNIAYAKQEWWNCLLKNNQIATCFENKAGDEGEKILKNYISGDKIIAYATGYGAIGWGIIEEPNSYHLVQHKNEDCLNGDCLHRISIKWKAVAKNLSDAVEIKYIKEKFDIYHPLRTSVSINAQKAEKLIEFLNNKFQKV